MNGEPKKIYKKGGCCMKHLLRGLAVLLILVVCLGVSAPVFADDPPDTEVNVGVVAPGDVDLDIGINAGGDVTVDVNGAPMASQQQLADAQRQLGNAIANATAGGAINSLDWWRYYHKWIEPQFKQLLGQDNFLAEAVAKLIQEKTLSDSQTVQLVTALNVLSLQLAATTRESKQEDNRIMDQLINGAEAHITIQGQLIGNLSGRVDLIDLNQETVDSQIARLNAQLQALDAARVTDFNNLVDYIHWVRQEHISMLEGVGAVLFAILVSLGLCVWQIVRLRKRML